MAKTSQDGTVLDRLFAVVESRRDDDPQPSGAGTAPAALTSGTMHAPRASGRKGEPA